MAKLIISDVIQICEYKGNNRSALLLLASHSHDHTGVSIWEIVQ